MGFTDGEPTNQTRVQTSVEVAAAILADLALQHGGKEKKKKSKFLLAVTFPV